ncbi:MAG: hypothetical protein EP341_05610 [Sphingomonadales bacterium]|nr:MAG: hypothetical protein EP341_05610 [Sphingomonadales bacterium]
MEDETDNLSFEDGTDSVDPSDTDTPETWDYYDPDEDDQDTGEIQEAEGTEDEEGEAEDQPQEEAESEEEQEPAEPQVADENAVVKLADGREMTVAELTKGNMMQADYTRKSQELATRRKAVEEDASRIEQITQTFIDHLANMIPPEPDAALALRDPGKYTAQKAQYDAAVAQVQKLVEIGSQPKEIKDGMSEADRRTLIADENTKLVSMFPETGTKDGREKFFGGVQEAAEQLGFTAQELSGISDHRLFALAHWAKRGMEADKARKAVKAKAQKAPPATPNKPGSGAKKANRNADAMRRLGRTGSIRDALAVDFD